MASRFRPNTAGILAFGRSEQMATAMRRRAEVVRAVAESSAPFDPEDPDGHFRDSFEVAVAEDRGVAVGIVYTTDPAGAYIELGTSDTPAHHTLHNALAAAGLRTRG